ncbi:hypothetical protein ACJ73_00617 [Blastomyces percursus]|uniref:Uncharacterized protein n=1 Tax=Blastomyces percursus TaxID=1658174 RepID=A0A1J9QHL4_9EURO|nr:hypothetical protein ACJ73_00617 [Blastomyces percursus]
MAPSRLAHVWARNATSKPTDRSKLPPSDHWEGDALGETLDKQEYIIVPLSQVKILKLVFKRDGDEMYQIVGRIYIQETQGYGTQGEQWKYSGSAGKAQHLLRENISHTSLTLADDPIIIDESMSPTNLPCGFYQFVAIHPFQRNIEKVPEGYKVYVNMTLDDLQEHGGLELLAVYYSRNNERRRTRSRGLYLHHCREMVQPFHF